MVYIYFVINNAKQDVLLKTQIFKKENSYFGNFTNCVKNGKNDAKNIV